MPFANYKFPEGLLTAEQKEEIIHRTTDLFAHYLGDGVRAFSMVLVDEVVDGGWGRADEVLTRLSHFPGIFGVRAGEFSLPSTARPWKHAR
jgi:4-oxalocrotonate tautomerase